MTDYSEKEKREIYANCSYNVTWSSFFFNEWGKMMETISIGSYLHETLLLRKKIVTFRVHVHTSMYNVHASILIYKKSRPHWCMGGGEGSGRAPREFRIWQVKMLHFRLFTCSCPISLFYIQVYMYMETWVPKVVELAWCTCTCR